MTKINAASAKVTSLAIFAAEANADTITAQKLAYRREVDRANARAAKAEKRIKELEAQLATDEATAVRRLTIALANMEELVGDCDVPERRVGGAKLGKRVTLLTLLEADRFEQLSMELVRAIYNHPTCTPLCSDCRQASCEGECGAVRRG